MISILVFVLVTLALWLATGRPILAVVVGLAVALLVTISPRGLR